MIEPEHIERTRRRDDFPHLDSQIVVCAYCDESAIARGTIALLPEVDSGHAWADRGDHQPVWAEIHGEWKDSPVAARPR